MSKTQEMNDSFDHLFKKESNFYDDFITGRFWYTRLINRIFLHQKNFIASAALVFSMLPKNFTGRMLDVPCGTGVLTKDLYLKNPNAQIVCLDYSNEMIARFKHALSKDERPSTHITFQQGDVACLPYENESFDLVLSMNGYQCFPKKDESFKEIKRVLKKGGLFIGSAYIKGRYLMSDFLVKIYDKKGIMSPPHENAVELKAHLEELFKVEKYELFRTSAHFCCLKE